MRGMFGRLCHGRPRGPLEPYSAVAPFVRMLAWGALFVGALSGLVMIALIALRVPEPVAGAAGFVMVTAPAAALPLRVLATACRPTPVSTSWEWEARP